MSNDCSKTASTSALQQHDRKPSEAQTLADDPSLRSNHSALDKCQVLLCKRMQLARSDPNSKDPSIVAQRKDISSQLATLICESGGVRTLLLAMEQIGDSSFWNTAIACYSLSAILLSIPPKNFVPVMTEFRKIMMDPAWGEKLSLLLAALLEICEKLPKRRTASPADLVFVDYILRPCERLWEGRYGLHSNTGPNGQWDFSLDGAIWIANCWLKHSDKMKRLEVHSRLNKLFTISMVMNGRLSTLTNEQLEPLKTFKSALLNIINGIVGSTNDTDKNANMFVDSLVALSQSNLPVLDFSFTAKSLIKVVDETAPSKDRQFIFHQLHLDISPQSERDATTNLDAYIDSLIQTINSVDKKQRTRLLINLWSACVQKWTSSKHDQQWSLSASKWCTSSDNHTKEQIPEKQRFIVEYLMSALESLLDNIAEDLDQPSISRLVQISKNLISTSLIELNDEFSRISALDLRASDAGFDTLMQTRAKTLHLAIGLCGFVLFQDDISKEMKREFNELLALLRTLLDLIHENKHLPIGELQSVADSAQQIISLSGQFLHNADSSNLPSPINLQPKPKQNDFAECMRIIESDFANEVDGSVEIAERGHAIITLEKAFRNKRLAEFDSLDGGLSRIFDVLADNLRHPDSYVYLASINALSELSSRHHKTFLPKMMFLLKNWSIDDAGEDSDDDDDSAGGDKPDSRWIRMRCRVQMGEAIAKVTLSLGDLAPSYFNELSQFFLDSAKHTDQIVSASALSGLSNLILACRGRYFTKIINELVFCCEAKLTPTNDQMVRRAGVHLLRSIVTSCQTGVFTDIKEVSSKIMSSLRKTRANDSDSVVRLHADLALLEIETLLNDTFSSSLDKNTHIVK